jgi:hypothetical protein
MLRSHEVLEEADDTRGSEIPFRLEPEAPDRMLAGEVYDRGRRGAVWDAPLMQRILHNLQTNSTTSIHLTTTQDER